MEVLKEDLKAVETEMCKQMSELNGALTKREENLMNEYFRE